MLLMRVSSSVVIVHRSLHCGRLYSPTIVLAACQCLLFVACRLSHDVVLVYCVAVVRWCIIVCDGGVLLFAMVVYVVMVVLCHLLGKMNFLIMTKLG